jgi:hypothetical protein
MVHFDGGSWFYNLRGLPENLLADLHLSRLTLCFLSFKMILMLLFFGTFPSFLQFTFFFKKTRGEQMPSSPSTFPCTYYVIFCGCALTNLCCPFHHFIIHKQISWWWPLVHTSDPSDYFVKYVHSIPQRQGRQGCQIQTFLWPSPYVGLRWWSVTVKKDMRILII